MSKRTRKALGFATDSSEDESHDFSIRHRRPKILQPPVLDIKALGELSAKSCSIRSPGVADNEDDSTILDVEEQLEDANQDEFELGIKANSNEGNEYAKLMPKGYKMLTKMGYKLGNSLGAQPEANNTTLKVQGQTTRQGIKLHSTYPNPESFAVDSAEFRDWSQQANSSKRKDAIFMKMQKLAFQMSGDADLLTEHPDPRDFNVLWRSYIVKLLQRTNPSHSEHKESELNPPSGDEELALFEELGIDEKISQLHNYLRVELRYCFYCGAKYADDEDLYLHCPGFKEEDHQ
ncbi:HCL035Cp [Eremothecium sinecaudum]|uniref:HCL035Cp n=1 Tax=Eremothecium sinecaudum TaxID=45286 RepID=A0A109UYQ3_9SACH|nr:HCL035Cp [Eremothecium sinecaudum]AMD20116.1 HCL035Cp [Eremothecium sinecaudum]